MTVLNSNQVEAETIVYENLEQKALSVEEIISILSQEGIPFSRRVGKEIAWKLAGEGKARFNSKWSLELQK